MKTLLATKHFLFKLMLLAAATLLLPALAQAQAESQQAVDLVQAKTQELISLINQNRDTYQTDEAKFFNDIDQLLSPVIDIKRIARRVMARHYQSATPEQYENFVTAFKQSLMNIYAKGLLQYDNQKIEVKPLPKSAQPQPNKQRVDVDVYSSSGNKYPISYSMFFEPGNGWKIENMVVNGINIGLTYRGQFDRLVREKKGDIDQVIVSWTSEVVTENQTN